MKVLMLLLGFVVSGCQSGGLDNKYLDGIYTNAVPPNPKWNRNADIKAASALANSLKSSSSVNTLTDAIAAARIADKPLVEVLAIGKKLAIELMKDDVTKELPELAKLEIALSAIRWKKYGMAEYFLGNLANSRNREIRASAFNAYGLIALYEERVPEAVQSFRQALAVDSNYGPAALNLGVLAAKHGDIGQAQSVLGNVKEDFAARSALVVAYRNGGESGAGSLCEDILDTMPNHKENLFNCALHALQNENEPEEGKELLRQAARLPGGSRRMAASIQKLSR